MAIERQRTAQAAVSVNAKRSGPPPPARSARKKFCGAGTSTIAVDPYGNVYPCVQWRRPVGNLHLQPVAEIWGQSPELQRTRDDSERVASFVTQLGPKSSVAGFCPGAAEQLTGSPDRLYPTAKRRISIVVV
jgi:MoaA/NifB/PqqE/SkfB family radical SAM enzyme